MPVRRIVADDTWRAAWRRVVRLWRPMLGWTLSVWLAVAAVFGPLTAAALGRYLVGADRVLGNEELLRWLVSPLGLLYLVLSAGLALTAAVVRYAGLFRIVSDDLEGRRPGVARTVLGLAPQLPALFRLSLATVTAGVVAAVPLAGGLAAIYFGWLADHDINYYLFVQPAEWRLALAAAALWASAWTVGVLYLGARVLPVLPAYLDGHRPLGVAVRRSLTCTRGSAARLLRLLAAGIATWLLLRAVVDTSYLMAARPVVEMVASLSSSVAPILLATAGYAAGAMVFDALVSFAGFSLVAAVLTKFYYEDTHLHADVPPAASLAERLRPWLRPGRAVPVLLLVALTGAGLSRLLLPPAPGFRPVVITAHRAGMLHAPENTLLALELAIAAGADAAEIDVQQTRDGEITVIHDADLMRMAGSPRRVADGDYRELRAIVGDPDGDTPTGERGLATLGEFLERARGRIGLTIELKYYGWDSLLAPRVVDEVRRRGMGATVTFMSLDLRAVRQLLGLAPGIPVGYVTAAAVGDLTRLPVAFLAVSRPVATPRLLRAAAERGIAVHVWTLNDAGAMVELVDRGVDGIITDDPALARRVLDQMNRLTPAGRLLLRFRHLVLEGDQ